MFMFISLSCRGSRGHWWFGWWMTCDIFMFAFIPHQKHHSLSISRDFWVLSYDSPRMTMSSAYISNSKESSPTCIPLPATFSRPARSSMNTANRMGERVPLPYSWLYRKPICHPVINKNTADLAVVDGFNVPIYVAIYTLVIQFI